MYSLIKYSEKELYSQKVSKEQKCAYHESGHVVMCHLFYLKFSKVSIIKDPITNEQGFVDTPDMLFDSYAFEKYGHIKTYALAVIQYFSGIISEAFFCGKYDWYNAQDDLRTVENIFIRHDVYNNKSYLWNITEKLVIKNWGLIDYLAKILLDKKELNNKQVKELLQGITLKSYPPALKT